METTDLIIYQEAGGKELKWCLPFSIRSLQEKNPVLFGESFLPPAPTHCLWTWLPSEEQHPSFIVCYTDKLCHEDRIGVLFFFTLVWLSQLAFLTFPECHHSFRLVSFPIFSPPKPSLFIHVWPHTPWITMSAFVIVFKLTRLPLRFQDFIRQERHTGGGKARLSNWLMHVWKR